MVPLTWSSGYNQWYLIACGRRISENSSFLHIYIYIYLIISHYNNTSCAWIFLNCISVTHFCQQQYSYWYMWYHAVTTILSTMNKTDRTSLKEANIKNSWLHVTEYYYQDKLVCCYFLLIKYEAYTSYTRSICSLWNLSTICFISL